MSPTAETGLGTVVAFSDQRRSSPRSAPSIEPLPPLQLLPTPMIRIIEINRFEDLEQYRSYWRTLLRETPLATFFQSYDWLEVYWRHFSAGQRLRVLVVERNGRPTGILPLVVREEQTRVGRVRVLTYPLDEWGTFYGPIGSDPAETLAARLAHIRSTTRDWDVVDLRTVDDERTDSGETREAFSTAGLPALRAGWNQASVIELAGTWDEYWSARNSHFRGNVRRGERKIRAAHQIEIVRYRPQGEAAGDANPRWDLFDMCVNVAQQSWQGSSTTGTTLSHDSIREFLRDVHIAAVRSGALDLNLLLIDGQPAAFMYNYHFQGHVSGLRMGFDAAVSRDGAGNVLVQSLIRDSFERGDRLLDLGPGHESYKRHWRTTIVPSYRYSYFAPTALRAQALHIKRRVAGWLNEGRQAWASRRRGTIGSRGYVGT
jgi:CelD/BcsL family acetyltransferase involved in cellulose biosynthesis